MRMLPRITCLLFLSCICYGENIDLQKYPYLFTVEDLKSYPEFKLDFSGNSETLKVEKGAQNSYIKYSYDTLEKNDFTEMFFSVYVEEESSEEKAKNVLEQNIRFFAEAGEKNGFSHKECTPLIKSGSQNYYAIRIRKSKENGFIFITRMKNTVYTILTTGLLSNDGTLFQEKIADRLRQLKN